MLDHNAVLNDLDQDLTGVYSAKYVDDLTLMPIVVLREDLFVSWYLR